GGILGGKGSAEIEIARAIALSLSLGDNRQRQGGCTSRRSADKLGQCAAGDAAIWQCAVQCDETGRDGRSRRRAKRRAALCGLRAKPLLQLRHKRVERGRAVLHGRFLVSPHCLAHVPGILARSDRMSAWAPIVSHVCSYLHDKLVTDVGMCSVWC